MSRPTILIVEDDRDLRRGLCLRLHAAGYDVATAEDGISAISVARSERPDLVLLDIGLPGGDGLTVLERYGNLPQLSSTPVVVLTGRDPRPTELAARRYGIAGFLRKPADNDELLETIRRALAGLSAPEDDPTPHKSSTTHSATSLAWK